MKVRQLPRPISKRRKPIQAIRPDVRYWHIADMLNALTNVRFWGQRGL
jgi:hypothetical protein